ncbi:extracellular solute-binding protein family 1 [Candidatus Moduliflexus flocculans]|uniref:Extracellular solute-binding protein family 1 n=1 Tax=Candidatus Moduliflexus flocculans TaxID=1499966 RepID=A0A0S6VPG0_9BACT|nr:extracellular solute-binding protein family 1 [Candidatus Moduliflexus flocculans]
MKRGFRRFWSTCMACLTVFCLVSAGFAADNLTPVKLTVFLGRPSQQPTPDNKIFKKIEQEFGVTFEFDILAGDLDQKLGVLIAGGDYPDMMTGDTKLIDAGAFIPLEDLIEQYAPNLKKHYEKAWYLMKYNDGHVYVLPNYGVFQGDYRYNESYGPAFWIQKAVLKEFGYPKVKTLDQYFDLIQQYKEKYPTIDGQETIGFEILSEGWRNFCLKNAPQHLVGNPNEGGVIVKDGVAKIFAGTDIDKRYFKKLNEVNQLGLIDRESFVLSYDQYLAKLTSGRVLGMFDQRWNFQRAEESLKTQEKILRTYAPCPVVYDESIKDYYLDRPPVNVNRGFGISVNAKDPVRIIKLLDALYDERWQKLLYWGVEGDDYLVNEQGRFYRTPEQRVQYDDPAWKQANTGLDFAAYSPKMEGTFSDGNATSPGMQPEEYYESLKPEDKELLNAYGYKTYGEFFSTPPENPMHYPAWSIPIEDGSPAKIASLKLDDLANKYLPKAILAQPAEFDTIWAEYVVEIGKVDVKAYEDVVNAGIQERIKNAQAQ